VSRLEAIVISLKQQPSRPKRGSIRQQTLIVEFGSAEDVKSLPFVQNAEIAGPLDSVDPSTLSEDGTVKEA
jgi:hypothetical protein